MKHIFVLRHAKAEKIPTHGSDHDRVLTSHSHEQTNKIAQWLESFPIQPDTILCSSATRTQQTYTQLKTILTTLPSPIITTNLYLATAGDIFHEINTLPHMGHNLMLIGHNPGLKDFCIQLANDSHPHIIDNIALSFPTCALAIFSVDTPTWANVIPYSGTLKEYITPERLP